MSSTRNSANSSTKISGETESTPKILDQTKVDESNISSGIKTHYAININVNPEGTEPTPKILDQIKVDEPCTSSGIKTHYAININVNPEGKEPTTKTLDETKIDEPSTSSGIKAHYAINISVKPGDSKIMFTQNESLSSLDELALQLLREKTNIIEDDSFVTVDGCREERATTTDPITLFSTNEQMQNMIAGRRPISYYQAPPPYDPHDGLSAFQSLMTQPPDYQERYVVPTQVMLARSDEPQPYRRHYEVINVNDILDAFNSTKIKNRFVQKVFVVLSAQLLLVFGIITVSLHEKNTRHFLHHDNLWYKVSLGLFIIFYMVLYRYKQARRMFPLNIVLLLLMTLSLAYLAAAISCIYKTHALMASFGVTTGVCISISLLGFQQSCEIVECPIFICLIYLVSTIYFVIAIVVFMVTHDSVNYLIYSCLMTLIFVLYLMFDMQQILGGQRVQILPDDYTLGAIQLYVDILLSFKFLLCMYRNT